MLARRPEEREANMYIGISLVGLLLLILLLVLIF